MGLESYHQKNSWRDFQSGYLLNTRRKKSAAWLKTAAGLSILILFVIALFTLTPLVIKKETTQVKEKTAQTKTKPAKIEPAYLSRDQLSRIVQDTHFFKTDKNVFFKDSLENNYKITTSLDVQLQGFLLAKMDYLKTLDRGKPQQIAIVAMEADTGKIVAMAGFDLSDDNLNPCLLPIYPAASIFKIVTAAAAVQSLNYNPATQLFFNGNKYTLYKRQLKDVKNKYTYKISFARAFAESVNPVFGKIGKNYLGKEKLTQFADAFGFNKKVNFELPFATGNFQVLNDHYHLAELGCGFNHDTTISPIFGAMLTSAIVNKGNIMRPVMVEHVTDTDGKIVYKYEKKNYMSAITPKTADTMIKLMERTVTKGTAKKTFRRMSKDKVLSKLLIGGKTGSLYNKAHTVKYDWFTGFGKEKVTGKAIALSVVVGHRKYIGTRAPAFAKMILQQYFKNNRSTVSQ